jgi:hypothetical protein
MQRQGSFALAGFHPPPSEPSLFSVKLHTSFPRAASIARPESARTPHFVDYISSASDIVYTACFIAHSYALGSRESHSWACERLDHRGSWEDIRRPSQLTQCLIWFNGARKLPKLRYRSCIRWCLTFAELRNVDHVVWCSPNPLYPRVQTRQGRWRYFGPAASMLDHLQGGSDTSQPVLHIVPSLALYRCVFGASCCADTTQLQPPSSVTPQLRKQRARHGIPGHGAIQQNRNPPLCWLSSRLGIRPQLGDILPRRLVSGCDLGEQDTPKARDLQITGKAPVGLHAVLVVLSLRTGPRQLLGMSGQELD